MPTLYFRVVVGEHDITAEDGQEVFVPSKWVSHPSYKSYNSDYDFAIVTLQTSLTWSDAVKPVCLPYSSKVTIICHRPWIF